MTKKTAATAMASAEKKRDETTASKGVNYHMGIAEQGKLYALEGNHSQALHYYRTAMNISVQSGDPEIFFRHYLECVMESLEKMEAYQEVLDYCDKAIELYTQQPPPNPMAVADFASIHQRRGIILLKMGQEDEAEHAFKRAIEISKQLGNALKLSQTLLRWVNARYRVDASRITSEQNRCDYFTVRPNSVDPSRAVKLMNETGPQL